MKEKRKRPANGRRVGVQGAATGKITVHKGNSKKSKQAGLAEVFTLERNAHGEFEIIGCLREGVL
ncbi:MAG: hypothetical protein LBJ63_11175 [Prevotellaceae bacterium]|nr:hypothetical protein [Prevotellaceae bacterium]